MHLGLLGVNILHATTMDLWVTKRNHEAVHVLQHVLKVGQQPRHQEKGVMVQVRISFLKLFLKHSSDFTIFLL